LIGKYFRPEGIRSLYRGALPYAALVGVAHWHFPTIWADEKKEAEFSRLENDWLHYLKRLTDMNKRGHGL